MTRNVGFYYVSGRGWLRIEKARCRTCKQMTNQTVERLATDAEKAGIIMPALQKNSNIKHVDVEFDEEAWLALKRG